MVVHTVFVEPFNPIIGAQYLVLGEVENAQGKERLSLFGISNSSFLLFLDPLINEKLTGYLKVVSPDVKLYMIYII